MEKSDFLTSIKDALSVDSQSEIFLRYGDFHFLLEPHGEEIEVKTDGKIIAVYPNFDSFKLNFKINDISFCDIVFDLELDY